MTTSKMLIAAVIAAVVAGGVFGGYKFLLSPTAIMQVASATPVGSTFNTAKTAYISVAPATLAASSTSILNPDTNGSYVTSLNSACTNVGNSFTSITGTGLASLTLTAATTSVPNNGAQGNTNTIVGTQATTTPFSLLQAAVSSTGSAVSDFWAGGTYLTLTYNATNTMACTAGVTYIPL